MHVFVLRCGTTSPKECPISLHDGSHGCTSVRSLHHIWTSCADVVHERWVSSFCRMALRSGGDTAHIIRILGRGESAWKVWQNTNTSPCRQKCTINKACKSRNDCSPMPISSLRGDCGWFRDQFNLNFPHHFYFLEENILRSYSLAGGSSVDLQSFRPTTGEQESAALLVLHSVAKRSWLIFFRKSGGSEKEQWVYSLIREEDIGAIDPWFNPGTFFTQSSHMTSQCDHIPSAHEPLLL